jgi:hypothetical protein
LVGPVNHSACAAWIKDNGDRTIKATNKVIGSWNVRKWLKQNCMTRGAHVGGGNERRKKQATADLISFLGRNGF